MRKKPYGDDLKAQLLASAKDRLSHFVMDGAGGLFIQSLPEAGRPKPW